MTAESDPWASEPGTRTLAAPPSLVEAEWPLIGMIMMRPSLFDVVADIVQARHFSEDANARLWEVIVSFHEHGIAVTMPLLHDSAQSALGWERKDVSKFLGAIAGSAVSLGPDQARHYARSLRDVWTRRELFALGGLLRERALVADLESPGEKLLEEVESKLSGIGDDIDSEGRGRSFAEALGEGLAQAQTAALAHEEGRLVGVPSGLHPIDKKLGGFRGSDLIVVGARPGAGKTAWALGVAIAAARHFAAESPDKPQWVDFYSLEMGADQLALRAAAAHSRVPFERIRRGDIQPAELLELEEANADLRDLPIHIDDTPSITVPAIRLRARRRKRRLGLGLIVIDYLQLVGLTREERRESGSNRVQEVSTITRNIKRLAKDLDVPVIALCQLSREVEKRDDKRPQLSDLRESGTIEQDADLVCFLYRDAYYLEQRPPVKRDRESEIDYGVRRTDWAVKLDQCKDKAEFMIAKNRHGSLGTLALKFIAELMLFSDDSPGDATAESREARKQQLRMDLMVHD